MPGIYIHIPFCKQACHYCDFHFSTSDKNRDVMVQAIARELVMRRNEADGTVETIYFGGGTPSVLSDDQLDMLLNSVFENYEVAADAEITLEANPDDLSTERLQRFADSRINRLSIGIQSFFDEDLKLMNRAHNASEATRVLKEAVKYFDNISIDLIYGIPGMSNERWKQNLEIALEFAIPHISSYALTVEPKTALKKLIATGKISAPDDDSAQQHFHTLIEVLEENHFIHYELSNFGKPGFFSKNNSAYWLGKKYIGAGPSAHSYDGNSRSWNISNNPLYIKSISTESLPSEKEVLTVTDRYNEYVMTGLRTIWGISLEKVRSEFGEDILKFLISQSGKYVANGLVAMDSETLKATKKGKFLTDGIASDLFLIN